MQTRGTRTWRVLDLSLDLDEPESVLRYRAAERAGLDPGEIRGLRIARKSLDARRRGATRQLRFVVHVDLVLDADHRGAAFDAARRTGAVAPAPEVGSLDVEGPPLGAAAPRTVVVGAGPGGLFAALVLARNGLSVELIDRGAELGRRGRDLVGFHRNRRPNPESNLLFGEGGAGTYSDGKLYTRVHDPLEVPCLEQLVHCGAPPEILYDSRAHIGTDRLHRILPRIRRELTSRGVRLHWNTRLAGLEIDEGTPRRITAAITDAGPLRCDALILSPGHSARDTLRRLHAQGVTVRAKPFQLGVRVEHPQPLIDRGRHGVGPAAARLGPAYYNLVCRASGGRPAAYSFCMCPGGRIMASVNVPGLLCTNGMSNSRHSSPWANAALVTTLGPEQFGDGPFAGVELQERLERCFFEAGGSDYTAPAQRADDFLSAKPTAEPRHSSYTFGTCPGRIDRLLPGDVRDAIAGALRQFETKIPGFAGPEGLLVGLESRSSGPLRLLRGRESHVADGFSNLYPVGEGAGYAGGIMSAAIDGARAALRLVARAREGSLRHPRG